MAANAFWSALERSSKSPVSFEDKRPIAFRIAEKHATDFARALGDNNQTLVDLGVTLKTIGTSISFKRNAVEVLAVNFALDQGATVRIVSPVVHYLKLSPAGEDVPFGSEVEAKVGEWLGRSLQLLDAHRAEFAELGA